MTWSNVTDPHFKGTPLFDVENLGNCNWCRYYGTPIGN